MAHGDGAVLDILVADDQHIRDLLQLSLTDLVADLLAAVVHLYAHTHIVENLLYLVDAVEVTVGYRQQLDLYRSQPQRERACVLLDKQSKGALIAADGGAVDDVGVLLDAVSVDILHTEFLGDHRVDLDGDEGVFLTEDVLDLDIELGTVERGFADTYLVLYAKVVEYLAHHALHAVPLFLCADVLFSVIGIPLGEAVADVLIQTQGLEHIYSEVQTVLKLALELLGCAHKMTLGDRELANAYKAVHLTGSLVAEERRRLVQSHGEVAVAPAAVEECLILEWAGHRAQGIYLGVAVGIAEDEHTVAIVIPVTADLIQVGLRHERGLGELPAVLLLYILDKALEKLDDARALGQHDRETLTDIIDRGEELELSA